jgi:FkbM family methyltransferase
MEQKLNKAIEFSKIKGIIDYRGLLNLYGATTATIIPVYTFWNCPIKVIIPDYTSCRIWLDKFTEKDFTRFLLNVLEPNDVFIDIGANIGYFSLLAEALKCKVYAFEPTKLTCEILRKNCANKNITVYNRAVYSKNGVIQFNDCGVRFLSINSIYDPKEHVPDLPKSFKMKSISVDAVTLDSLKLKPDFIKIDAEAAEYDILLGAVNTIEEHRPMISCEGSCKGDDTKFKKIQKFMSKRDYKLVTTVDNNMVFQGE